MARARVNVQPGRKYERIFQRALARGESETEASRLADRALCYDWVHNRLHLQGAAQHTPTEAMVDREMARLYG